MFILTQRFRLSLKPSSEIIKKIQIGKKYLDDILTKSYLSINPDS